MRVAVRAGLLAVAAPAAAAAAAASAAGDAQSSPQGSSPRRSHGAASAAADAHASSPRRPRDASPMGASSRLAELAAAAAVASAASSSAAVAVAAAASPASSSAKKRTVTVFTDVVFAAGWAQALALAREVRAVDEAAQVGAATLCAAVAPVVPAIWQRQPCAPSWLSQCAVPASACASPHRHFTGPLGFARLLPSALERAEEAALLEQVLALDDAGSGASAGSSAPLYRPISHSGKLVAAHLAPPCRTFAAALVAGGLYSAGALVVVQPPPPGVSLYDGSVPDIMRRQQQPQLLLQEQLLPAAAAAAAATAAAAAAAAAAPAALTLPPPLLVLVHDFFVVDGHFAQPPPALLRAIAEHSALGAAATAAAGRVGGGVMPLPPPSDFWPLLRGAAVGIARECEAQTRHLRHGGVAVAAAAAAAAEPAEPSPLSLSPEYALLVAWLASQRAATGRLVVRGVTVEAASAPARYVELPATWIVGALPPVMAPAAAAAAATAASASAIVEAAWRGGVHAASAPLLARMHAGSAAELGAMYGWKYSFALALGDVSLAPTTPRGSLPRPSVRAAAGAPPLSVRLLPHATTDIWAALVDRDDLSALRAGAAGAGAVGAGVAPAGDDGGGDDGAAAAKRRRLMPGGEAPLLRPPTLAGLLSSFGFTPPAAAQP